MGIFGDLSKMVVVVGVLAVAVSLVTEGLKAVERINRMPTRLVVYLVSLVITPACYVAYTAYMGQPIEWFMVFAAMLAAFLIAKVSMGGWDEVMGLVARCTGKTDGKTGGGGWNS